MRRIVAVVGVLGVLGWAGVQVVHRVTLDHYGDPGTPEGYLKRFVDHRLRLTVDREQLMRSRTGPVTLRGRLRNGGDRPLRDVVVTASLAAGRTGPPTTSTVHLGRFAAGEERTIETQVTVVTLPPDLPSDPVELFSEVTVERVEFDSTPGSTGSRP